MFNRPFPSLNKSGTAGEHTEKLRQVATYKNAINSGSGFGIADVTGSTDKVVVTARNYEELLSFAKGRHHCVDSSGADTLKYNIWSGNKMVVKYGENVPVSYTGNLDDPSGGTRSVDSNMIPYPNQSNGTNGYSGFVADLCGTLFGKGELGTGPTWVDNIADVSYTNTSEYNRGNKSQPLDGFAFSGGDRTIT